jgi:alpha-L-fucosidase 2
MTRHLLATLLFAAAASPLAAQDTRSGLRLDAPIERWDEALPVGNGILGGLLWGGDSTLHLSLDRGDLWDERTPEIFSDSLWTWKGMQALVAAGNMTRFHELFDEPYDRLPYPTKLPAGRLELIWSGHTVDRFELNLELAEAWAIDGTDTLKVVALADGEALSITGPGIITRRLVPPAGLSKLGYPEPALKYFHIHDSPFSDVSWYDQSTGEASVYSAAVWGESRQGSTSLLVQISLTSPDVNAGLDLLRAVQSAHLPAHRAWWHEFWSKSSVTLPDSALQAHYDLTKYFYGSAARRGAPPMPLQGVWTADEGGLPPWKGDYHNDLNTQMTYLAAHAAGLDDAVEGWLEFLEARLPEFRRFAREFYGVDGAVIPGVMTISGKPMGGWGMYSLSPTNGAWVAFSFWKQWRMTRDSVFLAERAYPFLAEIGTALKQLLVEQDDGRLVLPLSSSPEIHDNSIDAFLTPNSNYDQALMKWLFGALSEMADELGLQSASTEWAGFVVDLGPLHLDPDVGSLAFSAGESYRASHRHFSHAMAIHPLGILERVIPTGGGAAAGVEGSQDPSVSEIINRTIGQIGSLGTRQWTGYSFAWFAAMLARNGQGDQALRYLKDYLAFTSRNGFHVNGDQSGRGLSDFTYRPFTLEGNFMAMDAIQEMLVQSDGETLTLFPGIPRSWDGAAFKDLRVDGGYTVNASVSAANTLSYQVFDRLGAFVSSGHMGMDDGVPRSFWGYRIPLVRPSP